MGVHHGGMQHWLNQGDVINLWECIMGACDTERII